MYPPLADAPDLDRDSLIRVESPAHEQAVAFSHASSVLLEPPSDGSPWAYDAVPWVDEVDAELASAVNLRPYRARGARGQGVRVAVFDVQWERVEQLQPTLGDVSTHDCFMHPSCEPSMDTTRTRFDFERGTHGAGCAEALHTIAPEAELHLVRVNSTTMFENAVEWAIREDIDIISMSMSFLNLNFFDRTGPLRVPIRRLEEHGILLVTSAGNYARGHWQGTFVDSDGDGKMDFEGEGYLPVYLTEGSPRLYVTWDQFIACGQTDLDLLLRDADGWIVARSEESQRFPREGQQGHRCQPIEQVRSVPEDGWYQLEVLHRRGVTAGVRVDVLTPGGRIPDSHPWGTIHEPGLHRSVLTVGAIDAMGYLGGPPQPYSSFGPPDLAWTKPDLHGPDALSSAIYGPRGFFGTSAATPIVAGLVAVLMSDDPSLSPHEAAERLKGLGREGLDGLVSTEPVRRARLPLQGASSGCGERPMWLVGAGPLGLFGLLGWLRGRRRLTDGGSR
ncbi:MAG: hypothetical protein EA397_16520 [Deltaproteobacteria bacterium]|nr:MAG: hypothetical protein EA397_16520 [Deltaproteobacteria bacterium]